jgi:hypothetical protein
VPSKSVSARTVKAPKIQVLFMMTHFPAQAQTRRYAAPLFCPSVTPISRMANRRPRL